MKPVNGAVASEPARDQLSERRNGGADPLTREDRANLLRYMAMMRAAEERGDHPLPAGQDPGQLLRRLRPGGDLGRLVLRRSARATGCASCTATSAPTSSAASPRTATSPTTWAAAGGVTGGKDGNMHFGDRELGCVGMVSMLPDMALVATGMALAFKLRREPRVAMTYFGEGSTANGQWHEAMNFAGIHQPAGRLHAREQRLRLLDPERARVRGRPGRARARPTASPACSVDGNDVEAVFEASRVAAERARAGRRPDADRVPDDAHARPRRPRRHELRAARSCSRSGPSATRSSATRERLVAEHGFSAEEVDAIRAEVKAYVDECAAEGARLADARPGRRRRRRLRRGR